MSEFKVNEAATTVSRSRLANIDDHLRRRIDAREIPCAQTWIWRAGELVHASTLGYADVERDVPLRDGDIFRLFSMSKIPASLALMQCVERGLLLIDDPVEMYIPEWKELRVVKGPEWKGMMAMRGGGDRDTFTVPCERPMSVCDLLTHQSGLPAPQMPPPDESGTPRFAIGGRPGTLRDTVERLSEQPLDFQPGTAFSYGVSTDILGYLVEVVSGEPFDQYLQRHIFEPLGMVDTAFWVRPDQADRLVALYMATPTGLNLMDDPTTSPLRNETTYFSGSGGLVSTTEDYMRLLVALVNGGETEGHRIIGRKTLELMTQNFLVDGKDIAQATIHPSFQGYTGHGFGLGVGVTLDLTRSKTTGTPGEYYWTGAAGSLAFVDPAEDLAVVYMTQALPNVTSVDFRRPYGWKQLRGLIYAALT
jgi:CubicO group peptidase (beta-lactamase class C family)